MASRADSRTSPSADNVANPDNKGWTIWLRGPAPSGGAVVTLSSNAPAVASVPATMTVPAGAWTASFTASTTRVKQTRTVGITASYNGSSVSAKLTVIR